MQKNYKAISIEQFMPKRSLFSRLLPFLVCLSFMWLNFYQYIINGNSLGIAIDGVSPLAILVSSVVLNGIISYVIFEILLFIYKFFVGFSVYAFLIPVRVFNDKFRMWFLFRNLIAGVIYNLRIFVPYISAYLCIIDLIFNMIFILVLFADIAKKHVEPLVRQFVFRIMVTPIFIYEFIVVIRLVVGVL